MVIPNPFYVDELRPLTGEDEEGGRHYVLGKNPKSGGVFCSGSPTLVGILVPEYGPGRGMTGLSIGIGCYTAASHRSVAGLQLEMAKRLKAKGIKARYRHREADKNGVRDRRRLICLLTGARVY